MICALIMAGGRGTRFYPLSTEDKPKQFLSLIEDRTMIQMTVDRLRKIIPIEQIFVSTGDKYVSLTMEQLPYLPQENIIVEPIGRNTAPCVVFGAMQIKNKYPDANMAVLPSDALIQDVDEFVRVVETADQFLSVHQESVVTIGIEPNRPETGYGYIKKTNQVENYGQYEVTKVDKFVEKPNLETAKKYLDEGCYLWNAGIFIWNVKYVEKLAKQYVPSIYETLSKIGSVDSAGYEDRLFDLYPTVENISIDYAIMEKIDSIFVIPGVFGWDDVGTWTALERYLPEDNQGNVIKGKIQAFDSKNNISFSTHRPIVLMGVEDIFVLESDQMIVVGKKDRLKDVHKIKE